MPHKHDPEDPSLYDKILEILHITDTEKEKEDIPVVKEKEKPSDVY